MAKPYLSIIIPTRNHSENISLMLLDVDRYLREKKFSYEVLVVDDGSEDKTVTAVESLVPIIKNLRVIQNAGNRGVGTAVKIGLLASKGTWRMVADPQGTVSVSEFASLLPRIAPRENIHMFIASRHHDESNIKGMPVLRQGIEHGLNRIFRFAHRTPHVRDVFIPFLCISEEVVEPIFSQIKSEHFGYLCEAVALGNSMGYSIEETPITMDISSHENPISYLQTLRETITIWWQLRKEKQGKKAHTNMV